MTDFISFTDMRTQRTVHLNVDNVSRFTTEEDKHTNRGYITVIYLRDGLADAHIPNRLYVDDELDAVMAKVHKARCQRMETPEQWANSWPPYPAEQ